MTIEDDDQARIKTPTEKLAELVARRKASTGNNAANGVPGGKRQHERVAAAQSASKSKPALRK